MEALPGEVGACLIPTTGPRSARASYFLSKLPQHQVPVTPIEAIALRRDTPQPVIYALQKVQVACQGSQCSPWFPTS